MKKNNFKTLKILLTASILVNLTLFGFLGYKYLNNHVTAVSNKTLTNQSNDTQLKFFLGRNEVFTMLPNDSNEIIMLGNSLTHNFEWHEMFPDVTIKNRGINGDITLGVLQRLPEITESKPAKIFIEIGVNDIQQGFEVDEIILNYGNILKKIKSQSSTTKVYVQSILPTNLNLFGSDKNIEDIILDLNSKLEQLCIDHNITFIDLYATFNDNGKLKSQYDCGDHLHLNGDGYLAWCNYINSYIYE